MQLQVIDSTTIKPVKQQKLSVHYNPDKEYTCINCDVDIVTLSLAINVLQNLFDTATAKLDVDLVEEIKTTTRKAALQG